MTPRMRIEYMKFLETSPSVRLRTIPSAISIRVIIPREIVEEYERKELRESLRLVKSLLEVEIGRS